MQNKPANLTVGCECNWMFINRQQAGILLAKQLTQLIAQDEQLDAHKMIVLALPRGGVPVGLEIALTLNCPLNVITSKKIGAPDQPELAIGAVTSNGVVIVDSQLKEFLRVPQSYIDKEREYLANKTKMLEHTWRQAAQLPEDLALQNKQVIVVDDGVATGMTAIAAACSLREQGAAKTIFATPVISRRACNLLQQEYNQVVALEIPEDFKAVGQFYIDFSQTSDAEVVSALTLAKCRQNSDALTH